MKKILPYDLKKTAIIAAALFSLTLFIPPSFGDGSAARDRSGERLIKKGDLLYISVAGHGDLTRERKVNNEGNVVFPLIKEINAEGKSVEDLAIDMDTRLFEFIKYPQVTISYNNVFFIYGEVNRPGEYKLEGHINVLKAIVVGGGFTDFASHRVKIIKNTIGRKDIWVNVDRVIQGKGKDKEILVEPGDIIVVPGSFF